MLSCDIIFQIFLLNLSAVVFHIKANLVKSSLIDNQAFSVAKINVDVEKIITIGILLFGFLNSQTPVLVFGSNEFLLPY